MARTLGIVRHRFALSLHHALLGLAVIGLTACAHEAQQPQASPSTRSELEQLAAPPSDAEIAALSGTWVFSGDKAEQARLDTALEFAVADLGFLVKDLAAQGLRVRMSPRDQYTVSFEGTSVSIATPGFPIQRGLIGGPAVTLRNQFGEESQDTFRFSHGALEVLGTNSDGSGGTIFTPGPEGRSLEVRRLAQSRSLSAPVDVRYSYRRKEGP